MIFLSKKKDDIIMLVRIRSFCQGASYWKNTARPYPYGLKAAILLSLNGQHNTFLQGKKLEHLLGISCFTWEIQFLTMGTMVCYGSSFSFTRKDVH